MGVRRQAFVADRHWGTGFKTFPAPKLIRVTSSCEMEVSFHLVCTTASFVKRELTTCMLLQYAYGNGKTSQTSHQVGQVVACLPPLPLKTCRCWMLETVHTVVLLLMHKPQPHLSTHSNPLQTAKRIIRMKMKT
ncbi:Hypp9582 [Branchiostoma lanceolatum]|uniref:Hypp9582 protein n=1 Tax=Branchiostoma lanceolatum TaxID=7740 RepID=A0A8S4MP47_BRALA|nr:Hypp9582 [Branchiostoma lanceolatum]